MQPRPDLPDQQRALEAADRVARATHLWVRHGTAVTLPKPGGTERQDTIAGIIFGLCYALGLDERHALLSAYAYALIDGDPGEALRVARSMILRRDDERYRVAYQRGARVADELIMLVAAPDPVSPA